jgi:hypothetical protein
MKRLKYGNRKVVYDGRTFDSQGECDRYKELYISHMAGNIELLYVHRPYPIVVNTVLVCTYVADFVYRDRDSGELVVEDFKSIATKTPVYRLKKKLMLAVHGISIKETFRARRKGGSLPAARGLRKPVTAGSAGRAAQPGAPSKGARLPRHRVYG